MRALIIGATGAVGSDLVSVLLQDPGYKEVVAFVRRPSKVAHAKYSEVITDFENLEAVSESIKGDVWFSCLGTTLKAVGSKEKQWQIDYDSPAQFGAIARRNEVRRAVVVSAYGASANSKVFYSKLKGTLDETMIKLDFDQCLIFRPAFLLRKDTVRPGERIVTQALKLLNRLGMFKRFRPLPTLILAQMLAKAPKVFASGKHIIEQDGSLNF